MHTAVQHTAVSSCLSEGSLTKYFEQLKLRRVGFADAPALHHLRQTVFSLVFLQNTPSLYQPTLSSSINTHCFRAYSPLRAYCFGYAPEVGLPVCTYSDSDPKDMQQMDFETVLRL